MPNTNSNALDQIHHRLLEAFDELYSDFVDPRGAYCDDYGSAWQQLDAGTGMNAPTGVPFSSEQQLAEIRNQCRVLAAANEYAINGHENRISYIVGTGHTYLATPRKGMTPPDDLVRRTQDYLDHFLLQNDWRTRQEEIVRRRDRDGEVFLRFFVNSDATTQIRFVEPAQIATPSNLSSLPHASFGIQTDPHDVESPHIYFIDGQPIPAVEIQHRKANVDRNVKRGLPLFYPVRKNLRRAEKLLRNMSVLAEIQSAIALIRKHRGTTASGVRQFAASSADATATNAATGQTHQSQTLRPRYHPRQPRRHRIRLPRLGPRRQQLCCDSESRTPRHCLSFGDARVHAHLGCLECQLFLDAHRRRPCRKNVRPTSSPTDRRRPLRYPSHPTKSYRCRTLAARHTRTNRTANRCALDRCTRSTSTSTHPTYPTRRRSAFTPNMEPIHWPRLRSGAGQSYATHWPKTSLE